MHRSSAMLICPRLVFNISVGVAGGHHDLVSCLQDEEGGDMEIEEEDDDETRAAAAG